MELSYLSFSGLTLLIGCLMPEPAAVHKFLLAGQHEIIPHNHSSTISIHVSDWYLSMLIVVQPYGLAHDLP